MNSTGPTFLPRLAVIALLWPCWTMAFDSGSTGADGAFSPTADTTLGLPEDGVFNFTTVNIPSGVTVSFTGNRLNTPVVLLVQGDAVIDGSIDISGVDGGALGITTPGGFPGGGGVAPNNDGANGLGPGGGTGGRLQNEAGSFGFCAGAGGGFGRAGSPGNGGILNCKDLSPVGGSYGSANLQPLLGGSGGGGGSLSDQSSVSVGAAGGGGAGAMLLAVSGTLTVSGSILAKGGTGQSCSGQVVQGSGGGGSGGGVRLIASNLTGAGNIEVSGGEALVSFCSYAGGQGGAGRVRLEADVYTFSGTVTPASAATTSAPRSLFVANLPSIRITSVAGRPVSAFPNGENDVALPKNTSDPITVEFAAVDVPLGTTVQLQVTPVIGEIIRVDSGPLTGSVESSVASVDLTLPQGSSVLSASISFTVAQAGAFAAFTDGEAVERITLRNSAGGVATATLVTVSGKEYTWPSSRIAAIN